MQPDARTLIAKVRYTYFVFFSVWGMAVFKSAPLKKEEVSNAHAISCSTSWRIVFGKTCHFLELPGSCIINERKPGCHFLWCHNHLLRDDLQVLWNSLKKMNNSEKNKLFTRSIRNSRKKNKTMDDIIFFIYLGTQPIVCLSLPSVPVDPYIWSQKISSLSSKPWYYSLVTRSV